MKSTEQWVIDSEELIKRLSILELVTAKLGVPSSEFYKIDNLGNGKTRWSISSEATGVIKIQGEGEWPHPKSFHLDRRMMVPFVMVAKNLRKKAPFAFQFQGKQLIVTQGRRRAEFLATSVVEGYSGSSAGVLVDKLGISEFTRNLIYCARNCATPDSLKPEMNCVYVEPTKEGLDILATNETIMYRARSKAAQIKEAVPFPLFLVTLLNSDGLKAIEWKKNLVALRYQQGEIWQSVSAKARREFPKEEIERFIREGAKKKLLFRVASRKLTLMVQRLALYLAAVRRADWVLQVKGFKGKNKIRLESWVTNSTFKESLTVDGEVSETFDISWPLDALLPILDFIGKKNKEIPMEVRLWETQSRKKSAVLASYIKTGNIEMIVPSRVV